MTLSYPEKSQEPATAAAQMEQNQCAGQADQEEWQERTRVRNIVPKTVFLFGHKIR